MRLSQNFADDLKIADNKGRLTLGSKYAGKRFAVREEADGSTHLIPIIVVPEQDKFLTSRQLNESFAVLEALADNWDGYASPVPSPSLIAYAREVFALLQADALARGVAWREPHIGSNERGQITLEWWQEQRTLTVFVRSENQVDYLKSWGNDIFNEMEDGELSRIFDFIVLSRWLYREETQAV